MGLFVHHQARNPRLNICLFVPLTTRRAVKRSPDRTHEEDAGGTQPCRSGSVCSSELRQGKKSRSTEGVLRYSCTIGSVMLCVVLVLFVLLLR